MAEIATTHSILIKKPYSIKMRAVIFLCASLSLGACSAFDKTLEVSIFSHENANVNVKGQPSPLVIHAMTLKDQSAIQHLKATELYNIRTGALSQDLLKLRTFNVLPRITHKEKLKIAENDRFFALTGSYRRHKGGSWKSVHKTHKLPSRIYFVAEAEGLRKITKDEFNTLVVSQEQTKGLP